MAPPRSLDDDSPPWLLAVTVRGGVELPGLGSTDRDGFVEWLWMRFGDEGLVAIDEGSVDAAEAWAAGFAPSALVIDTAAAPADRDWVAEGALPLVLVFADEPAARGAAAVLGRMAGAEVAAVRPAPPPEPTPDQSAVAVPGFGWILPPGGTPPEGRGAPGPARVVIDAGSGFGTGLHPTTRLCLRAVADHVAAGRPLARVLDVGAGSGILGIAAAVAGAAAVDAVEIDARVHAAIAANARLNRVERPLRLFATLADPPDGPPYDLVLANIVAAVLLELATALCRRLSRRGGTLVLCGLRAGEAGAVAAAYTRLTGAEPEADEDDGWVCLTYRL